MDVGMLQDKNKLRYMSAKWDVLPYSKILKDVTGGNSKIKTSEYESSGVLPIVDQGKLFIAGYTNQSKHILKTEPPIIIFGDHTRNIKFVDFSFAIGADGTKVLKVINDNAFTKFVYYYLKFIDIPNTGYNRHFKYIKDIVFPLPPLSEQKRIAGILDKADKLRQTTRKLIEQYDQLAQSLFLDMFGDPVTNPKGWEKRKLIEVCRKITDGTHHSPKPTKNGVPYITAKHVKTYGIDFYSKPTYISKEDHELIYKRCNPEKGDVLYIKDGVTTGIAALNNFSSEFSMLSSLALIKPELDLLNPSFLVSYLNNHKTKRNIMNRMSGGAIQRLTIKKINAITITLPPIFSQELFAEKIKLIEKQKELAQKSLEESENLFQALMQKAFKGEL